MKVLVNTCTVGVPFVKEIEQAVAARGVTVVDSPISGGPAGARRDGPQLLRREGVQVLHHAMGSLGDGGDPERPVQDQALTTVDARIASRYAKRLPLVDHAEAITNVENRCCRMTAMGHSYPFVHRGSSAGSQRESGPRRDILGNVGPDDPRFEFRGSKNETA
jgi:6-phosphogluconate dehydrogenase-like protein